MVFNREARSVVADATPSDSKCKRKLLDEGDTDDLVDIESEDDQQSWVDPTVTGSEAKRCKLDVTVRSEFSSQVE
ncbi:hypothetical protein AgCh_004831 [Apium graveolens]